MLPTWLEGRLHTLKAARSERVYRAAQERLELTRAAGRYRELKRELGVIDFGDQIERAIDVMERSPRGRRGPPGAVPGRAARRVPGHERRPGQADAARVRRRASGHRGRRPRPEHLRVARARRSTTCSSSRRSSREPTARRRRGSRCTRTSGRGRGSSRRPTRSSSPCRHGSGPTPSKQLVPHPPNGEGEVTLTRCTDEWTEASGIAERVVALHDGRRGLVRRRRPLPHEPAVRAAPAGVRRAWGAGGGRSDSPGCSASPRSSRCSRTRAPSKTRPPPWRSPGS